MSDIRIQVPEKAKRIIDTIMNAGYEAYVVGGCVRDSVLGREPNDWDITTSAKPEQVKALFSRTLDTGLQHGTVTIMDGKEGFEVTTYRIDGEYEDSRHPKEVTFTSDLVEDLKRRDFTINAMAYNDKDGLVDVFGGMEDMQAGIIRCVGDPRERFKEDALRILRAVRFSAQLGYTIEEETRGAIREFAPNLANISAERIQTELLKLLVSPNPDRMRDCYELGTTAVFLPELDVCMKTEQHHKHHMYTVGEHILHSLKEVPGDKVLRLSMLFHDIAKPACLSVDGKGQTHFYGHPEKSAEMAKEILKRLKFDNDTIRKVCTLVRYHDYGMGVKPDMVKMRKFMNKAGEDAFPGFFQVRLADIYAQSEYQKEEKLESLKQWENMYREILDTNQCVSLKTLAVSGADLIASGMKPGREMGEVLQKLLDLVLADPSLNEKEYLLQKAKELQV